MGSAPPYSASDDPQVQALACDSHPILFPSQCGIHPFHVKQIFCTIKIKTNFTNHDSEIPTDVSAGSSVKGLWYIEDCTIKNQINPLSCCSTQQRMQTTLVQLLCMSWHACLTMIGHLAKIEDSNHKSGISTNWKFQPRLTRFPSSRSKQWSPAVRDKLVRILPSLRRRPDYVLRWRNSIQKWSSPLTAAVNEREDWKKRGGRVRKTDMGPQS